MVRVPFVAGKIVSGSIPPKVKLSYQPTDTGYLKETDWGTAYNLGYLPYNPDKLTDQNIKSGDYLYAVRTSEPNDIWVVYSPISESGPGENIDWGEPGSMFEYKFHHSCLVEPNQSVYIAGELRITDEKKIYINCSSGHYLPKETNLKLLISLLKEKFPDYKL